MDVTVVVATFGQQSWVDLAHERAIPSAEAQAPTLHVHDDTLALGRNAGLAQVETEFVVFLDADDELAPDYIERMSEGTADLRAPAVSYVRKHRAARAPGVPKVSGHAHECTTDCLREGNWLVVGTAARTETVRSVGGWKEWPVYEDWDLFLRCWLAGATVEAIPEAVYIAHVRFDSRNRAPAMSVKNQVHHEIVAANFG